MFHRRCSMVCHNDSITYSYFCLNGRGLSASLYLCFGGQVPASTSFNGFIRDSCLCWALSVSGKNRGKMIRTAILTPCEPKGGRRRLIYSSGIWAGSRGVTGCTLKTGYNKTMGPQRQYGNRFFYRTGVSTGAGGFFSFTTKREFAHTRRSVFSGHSPLTDTI